MIMKNDIPTYEIIDSLENNVSMINIYRKQGKLISIGTELTTLLESLNELIARSLIIYFSLDLKEDEDNNYDAEEEEYNRVTPADISKANKLIGNILLKIVSGELILNDDKDDDRMEQAAKIIAHLSGRGGTFLILLLYINL